VRWSRASIHAGGIRAGVRPGSGYDRDDRGGHVKGNSKVAVVVLAAGKGKRMKSDVPKVVHLLCGRPVVGFALDAVNDIGPGEVVLVVSPASEMVREAAGPDIHCVEQPEPLGTGHAVQVALKEIGPEFEEIIVIPGDSPLISGATLQALLDSRRGEDAAAAMMTVELEDPSGYGRVIRDADGNVKRVVEEADASEEERAVKEINACTYAFERSRLEPALETLTTDNAQGEYYLTGVVERYVAEGSKVAPVPSPEYEALGINDRAQMALAEAFIRRKVNGALMAEGVTLVDPDRTYIDYGVEVGRDTVIMPLVFITGGSRIGERCRLGPCTAINDSVVGDRSSVEFSWLDGSEVGEDVNVGPYSRLRPGCRVGPGAKVGSFVEMKKTVVGRGSKVPHLSYIGDAVIGEDVNVGAGSITCNYDGEKKHTTEIDDGAFLGSDTMLIAPVRVGKGAVTGAGSAISEDIPDGSLGIERCEQHNVPDWREKKKGKGRRNK